MTAKYIQSLIDNNTYCLSNGQFTRHLKDHGLTKYDYYVQYIGRDQCPFCTKEKQFNERKMVYLRTCGDKACVSKYYKQLYKDDSLKTSISTKSQKTWAQRTPEERKNIRDKISKAHNNRSKKEKEESNQRRSQTNQQRYNVKHIGQSEQVKTKIKQSNLKRFGVQSSASNDEVRNKMKQTCQERYGVDSYILTKKFKEQSKQTKKERYGNESYTNRKQAQETNIDRYGVKNPAALPHIKHTIESKFHEKYNGHPMQDETIKKKIRQTWKERYGADHPTKQHINYEFLQSDDVEEVYKKEGIKGICREANISESAANKFLREHGIDVIKRHTSIFEDEVYKYISNIIGHSIIRNDRSVLDNKELDIYIPHKRIAVECNGEFWHSEITGQKDKNYHINKSKKCKKQGIHLIHIWEKDWITKQSVVKNRLKAKLGVADKIFARNTCIDTPTTKEVIDFLNQYHMQGNCPSSINCGLYYYNSLVAVMTFGKSRYDKNADYELLRYCTNEYSIIGGASKLFNWFVNNYSGSIVSYNDNSWNDGKLYEVLGFENINVTPPAPGILRTI